MPYPPAINTNNKTTSVLRKRKDVWAPNERHYCAVCNVWMGSDRQSILLHENGKKHREKSDEALQQRRNDKLKEEKDRNQLEKSFQLMEEKALAAHGSDVASGFNNRAAISSSDTFRDSQCITCPPSTSATKSSLNKTQKKEEIGSWQERKRKREEETMNKKGATGEDELLQQQSENSQQARKSSQNKKLQLGEKEGHYQCGEKTFLEGTVYAPILEEEMTVQLWTGSPTMTDEYRRSEEAMNYWKSGIVIRIRKIQGDNKDDPTKNQYKLVCDISYLKNATDEDETIERKVDVNNIRIPLDANDDMLPGSVEEARIALMGGEEITYINQSENMIDENTGLSSWGVVSIRKTTVNNEIKEERARLRAKRLEEARKENEKEREEENRKMEEAKDHHGDESALGAFNVGINGPGDSVGYKGVKIAEETKVEISDISKSLSKGKKNAITFKKIKKKGSSMRKKMNNRRTTSADDD